MTHSNSIKRNSIYILFIISISILIFGLTFRGVWKNPTIADIKESLNIPIRPFGTSDRARFIAAENLAINHTFGLSREQADAAAPDLGYSSKTKKWYLLYAPGMPILAAPFYLIGATLGAAQIFTFLMVTLFSIGNLIIIYLISKNILRLPNWAGVFSSVTFGFATIGIIYATSLFQHQVTTFFILSGFYSVYKFKSGNRWSFLWGFYVWTSYALAILIDYSNAVIVLPIMLYFLIVSLKFTKQESGYKIKLRPALILTSIFFILITVLHGYYNKVNFGGWTTLSGSLPGYREGVQTSLDKGTFEKREEEFRKIQSKKTPTNFFSEFKLSNGLKVLTVAKDKGIFVFSPIFLLGFLGIFYAAKKLDLEQSILIGLVTINFFYYASWGDPWGGWAFGPRYLVPSMAILAIFVSYFIVNVKYKLTFKIFSLLLFIFSAAVSLVGAVTTSATPPSIEAPKGTKYGIEYSLDFLTNSKSSNFAYNYLFHNHLTLIQYWAILLTLISLVAVFVLFILPRFEKPEEKLSE